jgi:glycogen operon protein
MLDLPEDVSLSELLLRARVDWHGVRLGQPDLSASSHSLALTVWGRSVALHLILNAFWEPLAFELPPSGSGLDLWRRIVDTGLDGPDDFRPFVDAPSIAGPEYAAGPRSVAVLAARRQEPVA